MGRVLYGRGVKSYPERAGLGGGFHSRQTRDTPESTENHDQVLLDGTEKRHPHWL